MRKRSVPTTGLRHRLRPYQVEAGRAIARSVFQGQGHSISVMMARQAGKNELSAQVELLLLAAHIGRNVDAIKCAPTFQPQARISMRRLWSRLSEAGLTPICAREAGHIIRVGHARQVFLSAEPQSNVVGHTAQLLLEVDEAQDVDKEKFDKEFRPMAATANATTVYYGTPWDDSTLLEQACETHLELERRDGIRRHFEYDWQVVAECNPAYGRYVEGERQRLGENHPLFLTQYCLKPIAGGGRLFSASQRAQLQGEHCRQSQPTAAETYVAGLDIGGESLSVTPHPSGCGVGDLQHDATVLTIGRIVFPTSDALVQEPRLEVVEHCWFQGERHDLLYGRLVDLLGRVWQVRRVAVDATGLGEAVARFLATALRAGVVLPVRFSSESKSRLGYQLLAAVNGGRLKAYAQDGSPQYRSFWREMELARVAYRPNRTMNFFVEPSQGHDDYLMSLALLVEATRDVRPRAARGRLREEAWA
ncbi:MAG: hypothetical protein ACUVV3_06335 [Dehalococcoidia bacterium]